MKKSAAEVHLQKLEKFHQKNGLLVENLNTVADKNLQLEKASAEIDREIENLKDSVDIMGKTELTSVIYIYYLINTCM